MIEPLAVCPSNNLIIDLAILPSSVYNLDLAPPEPLNDVPAIGYISFTLKLPEGNKISFPGLFTIASFIIVVFCTAVLDSLRPNVARSKTPEYPDPIS